MATYFGIIICSWVDLYENFTAEVCYSSTATWKDKQLVAIVSHEPNEEAKVEIHPNDRQYAWRIPYEGFFEILKEARRELHTEDPIEYLSSNMFTIVTKKHKGLLNPLLVKYKGFINPASAIYVLDEQQKPQRLGFIVKEPNCDYEVELYPSNSEDPRWHFRYEEFLRIFIDAWAELEDYLSKNQ